MPWHSLQALPPSHATSTSASSTLPRAALPCAASALSMLGAATVAVLFGVIAVLSVRVVWDDYRFGETSPRHWRAAVVVSIWLPVFSALITLRAVGLFIRRSRSKVDGSDAHSRSPKHDRHAALCGLSGPDVCGRADWRRAGPGGCRRHCAGQCRQPVVWPAGCAAELLRWPGQMPAAGHSDVRAGGLNFDRSGVALRLVQLCRGDGRPWPRHAATGRHCRGHVPGRHLGLGPANAAAVGGVMIAAMSRAGYPRLVLGQRGGRGSGYRHPDPALGGVSSSTRCWCPAPRCPRCSQPAWCPACWPALR